MGFWEFIGFFIWGYLIITFIGILIGLVFDIFRDPTLSGWAKAGWVLLLVVLPIIGSVIYLITRGDSMGQRQFEYARSVRIPSEGYVASGAVVSPADEIAKARALLDAGSITASEYEGLKSRVLVGGTPRTA